MCHTAIANSFDRILKYGLPVEQFWDLKFCLNTLQQTRLDLPINMLQTGKPSPPSRALIAMCYIKKVQIKDTL